MTTLLSIFNVGLLAATVRIATPLLLAALGGLFTMRANMVNIGLEGLMIFGAFAAVLVSFYGHSFLLGLLAAMAMSTLAAAMFSLFTIRFKSNVFVAGIALNLFGGAFTIFLSRTIFKVNGVFSDPRIVGIPVIHIPLIERIPFVGGIVSGQSLLVYVAYLLVGVVAVILYRTPFGLRLRSVGEHPEAVETVGVNPDKMRYYAILLSGVFCGLAGAYLSLGELKMFGENMTDGRGFIALAAIYFGRGKPVGIMLACLIFGLAQALSLRLELFGIPTEFLQMIPYILSVTVLFIVSKVSLPKLAVEG